MPEDGRRPWLGSRDGEEVAFLRRVLIVAGVGVALVLAWLARDAVLLGFAGVIVAEILLTAAAPLELRFGMQRRWSLPLAGGLILAAAILVGLLIGSQVQVQVSRLGEILPRAAQEVQQRLGVQVPGLAEMSRGEARPQEDRPARTALPGAEAIGGVLGQVANFGSVVVNGLAAVVLAIVVGAFLAADPRLYRRGMVKLWPRGRQAGIRDALETSSKALRQWLFATLLAMTLVGLLVGLGTWALGLPAPLALALFAGLCEFVPVVGPIIGAVPALLLALGAGQDTVLWTLLLFLAIQQVESNLITPLVTERVVHIPLAVLLLAVVAFGGVLGLPGIVLAAPLTVVAYVLVTKLYVRETLGLQAEVPGEEPENGQA